MFDAILPLLQAKPFRPDDFRAALNGFAINSVDLQGNSLLHHAALHANLEASQILVNEFSINIQLKNQDDKLAIDLSREASVRTGLYELGFSNPKAESEDDPAPASAAAASDDLPEDGDLAPPPAVFHPVTGAVPTQTYQLDDFQAQLLTFLTSDEASLPESHDIAITLDEFMREYNSKYNLAVWIRTYQALQKNTDFKALFTQASPFLIDEIRTRLSSQMRQISQEIDASELSLTDVETVKAIAGALASKPVNVQRARANFLPSADSLMQYQIMETSPGAVQITQLIACAMSLLEHPEIIQPTLVVAPIPVRIPPPAGSLFQPPAAVVAAASRGGATGGGFFAPTTRRAPLPTGGVIPTTVAAPEQLTEITAKQIGDNILLTCKPGNNEWNFALMELRTLDSYMREELDDFLTACRGIDTEVETNPKGPVNLLKCTSIDKARDLLEELCTILDVDPIPELQVAASPSLG